MSPAVRPAAHRETDDAVWTVRRCTGSALITLEPPTIQEPHPPFWQGAGHADSIRGVAARGHNLLLDQFASIDETINRFNTYKAAMLDLQSGDVGERHRL